MDKYTVKTPQAIFDQIKSIHHYIENVLLSPTSAKTMTKKILDGIRSLETFPERGFDADDKVGRQISSSVKTQGILVANRKYIILYTINDVVKEVLITHLLPVKSDYAKLFL